MHDEKYLSIFYHTHVHIPYLLLLYTDQTSRHIKPIYFLTLTVFKITVYVILRFESMNDDVIIFYIILHHTMMM